MSTRHDGQKATATVPIARRPPIDFARRYFVQVASPPSNLHAKYFDARFSPFCACLRLYLEETRCLSMLHAAYDFGYFAGDCRRRLIGWLGVTDAFYMP